LVYIKDYRDPLYGFIRVNKLEQKLIDSIFFQRLRNIKQLGTTYLVYPSANHSRFEHSLGTLYVCGQIFQLLLEQTDSANIFAESFKWGENEKKRAKCILRLAGLLHDLGHAPFSHSAEKLFPENKGFGRLDHEDYTFKMITETELRDIIDNCLGKGTAEEVAEVAVNRAKTMDRAFLSELLTGDFGADRIDYLMRDSHHLGVQYGRFDFHRLLNTLHIRVNEEKKGPELAIEDGGLHTVEAFLLARYFMFLNVYFHKTRRILDYHLSDFIYDCLKGGTYPVDIESYLKWDDHKVIYFLQRRKKSHKAKRLWQRAHYRLAFETHDHPKTQELERFDWLKSEVEKKFGLQVVCDEASKDPYAFDQPGVYLRNHKTGEYEPLSEASSLIKSLLKIQKCRIYASVEALKEVETFCQEFWKERKKIEVERGM
jgi:HD superfamily phosphohydrolase